mmetsp:Transcript_126898/g.344538  ORF Transcript_126898/g.344538 Transcript_126898/m.344538 type:complete len:271 (-) Transcript_126898:362-1174(-)
MELDKGVRQAARPEPRHGAGHRKRDGAALHEDGRGLDRDRRVYHGDVVRRRVLQPLLQIRIGIRQDGFSQGACHLGLRGLHPHAVRGLPLLQRSQSHGERLLLEVLAGLQGEVCFHVQPLPLLRPQPRAGRRRWLQDLAQHVQLLDRGLQRARDGRGVPPEDQGADGHQRRALAGRDRVVRASGHDAGHRHGQMRGVVLQQLIQGFLQRLPEVEPKRRQDLSGPRVLLCGARLRQFRRGGALWLDGAVQGRGVQVAFWLCQEHHKGAPGV